MSALDPADHEFVYRLAWDPQHKAPDGRYSKTFENADLRCERGRNGKPRNISTDRKGRITAEALDERIATQRANPNVGSKRVTPIFLPLLTQAVRLIKDDDGDFPFSVDSDPRPPGNEGHCAIINVSSKGKGDTPEDRQYLNFLRTELIDLCGNPISKSELLAKPLPRADQP